MTDDRKKELAQMCAVQIRQASVIMKSWMADYGYHFVQSVFDSESKIMFGRLADKPVTESDMPILQDLVMQDLWPRLREQHSDLRTFLFGKLPAKYPGVFAEGAEFAFDPGWRPLLQTAAERLQTYPESWRARITGGKEKFGCLILFISFDTDQPGVRSEVDRLLEEIRLRSLSTCDICGGQGRLRLSSIAKTVCDKHVDVLGEMREDDGQWSDPWRWHMHEVNDCFNNPEPMTFVEEDPWTDAIDASLLEGMDPPVDRDTPHVADPQRATALGRRIDDDTWQRSGRGQELLIEFGFYIESAVRSVRDIVEEERGRWLDAEIGHWDEYSVAPLAEDDKRWLREYVLELASEKGLG